MAEYQTNLWAPWRMEYIGGIGQEKGCFICGAWEHPADDEANLVLLRGRTTITLLNRFPYSSGHVLIAPAAHLGEFETLGDDVLLEMMQRARDVKCVLQAALKAEGFNIGLNLGRCAGAGLPGHVHLHIVPRWSGDINFMPVLSDVKVIPQSLTAVRNLFVEHAQQLGLLGHDAG